MICIRKIVYIWLVHDRKVISRELITIIFPAFMSSSLYTSPDSAPTVADYVAKHEIPCAALKTDPRSCRPEIVGPDAPSEPFPIPLAGFVQKGFGRGGKDLGCPTGSC